MGCASSKSTAAQKSSNLLTVPPVQETFQAPPIKETGNHSTTNSNADKQKEKESKTIEQQQENDVKADHPIEAVKSDNSEVARDMATETHILQSMDDTNKVNDKKTANVEDEKEESSISHHPVFIIDDHDEISEDKSSKPSTDDNPVNISEQIEEEKPSLHRGDLTRFPSVQAENVDVPPPSDVAVEITREDIKVKMKEMSGRDRNFSQLSIGSNMQASSIISCDAGRDDVSIATPSIIVPNAFANDNWDLWEAVKYNKVDEVKRLCQKRTVKLDSMMGLENKSILHLAAERNSVESAEYLLEFGKMDPDVRDEILQGVPLHHAAENGCYRIAELFIKHGASINATDLLLNTPLHVAYAERQDEIVQLLLDHGADTELENSDGFKPLEQERD